MWAICIYLTCFVMAGLDDGAARREKEEGERGRGEGGERQGGKTVPKL